MTVDTAVKIDGEKCGLDMKSSCEDLPPTSVGGGGCDSNGDAKDDYVFVNGSDAASDDHGEVEGNNGELNVSEPNAEYQGKLEGGDLNVNGNEQLGICNGIKGKLDNLVKVNGGDSKLDIAVILKEEDDGIVDGGELGKENGKINSAHGDYRNNNDGEVDVEVNDLGVVEERCAEMAADEVKDGESGVEKGDDCNASVDDSCYPSLDNADKSSIHDSDLGKNTAVEAEPHVPHEDHENETKEEHEKLEDQGGKPEGIENNVDPQIDQVSVTVTDPRDSITKQSELLEADVRHQTQEDGVIGMRSADDDFRAPDSGLLLNDAITEEQSPDCPLLDLQSADSREICPVEAEAEVREQDELDPMGGTQELNSLDSEGIVCELQQNQDALDLTSELQGQGRQDILEQSEEADNQSNLELIASELDVQVLKSTVQSDETTTELTSDVNGTLETSAVLIDSDKCDKPVVDHELDNMVHEEGKAELVAPVGGSLETSTVEVESDQSDKPVVDHKLDRIHEEGKAELIAQGGESLETSTASLLDNGEEETVVVDVIDKKVSSENASFEEAVTVEEANNLSILGSVHETAIDEVNKDLDASYHEVGASGNEVDVPESSHDSGSCFRSENGSTAVPASSEVDLPVPHDSDIIREQGVVCDESYADDNCITCSAVESNSQFNMEDSNDTLPYPVNGTDSEVKPVNDECDVASKSSCDSVETLRPKISFGSFECVAPFSHNDNIGIPTDVLNKSGFTTIHSNGVQFSESNDELCSGVVSSVQSNLNEVSASLGDGSAADTFDGLNVNPDLVRRPFYYLIRLPRFDDVKLSEQIKECDMEVGQKTEDRDAVWKLYLDRKTTFMKIKSDYDAAKYEEREAHKSVAAKKREIDTAQSWLNLAKNAVTVEVIDGQMLNMERKIQHETLDLAEEKNLIREIKRLNRQREQLAANPQRQEQLHQAIGQRVETEQRLKNLWKEWDALRDNHAKAEENFKTVKKKYDEESAKLKDLYNEHKSLNAIRQLAYEKLQNLKIQAMEKNKLFYNYKNAAKAAFSLAEAGDLENLERHCVNQVETFMELWNKNDEFRKEYIRCNMKSTLRRFRTLDGRSLGPDEAPLVLRNFSDNRENASTKVSSVETVPSLDRDFPVIAKKEEEESAKKVVEQKKTPVAKTRDEPTSKNSLAEPSGRIEIEEKEEEHKLNKEEAELARKAEEKRREEEAARLKEKRRSEEIAKNQAALVRKQRNAEQAQARAEFRARKEAEEKKKKEEMRAKKKGRKVLASETVETEPADLHESLSSQTVREPEVAEKPVTVVKKSHKPALYTKQVKTTKSIPAPPAPLRNRSKRRIPQWAWWLVLALLTVILIFPLGNIDIVGLFKHLASGSSTQ